MQQIKDQLSAAADKQKFWTLRTAPRSSGDLKGALAQFNALAGKSGSMQSAAQDRAQKVSQLIAEANRPKPEPPKPPAPTPSPTPTPGPAPTPIFSFSA